VSGVQWRLGCGSAVTSRVPDPCPSFGRARGCESAFARWDCRVGDSQEAGDPVGVVTGESPCLCVHGTDGHQRRPLSYVRITLGWCCTATAPTPDCTRDRPRRRRSHSSAHQLIHRTSRRECHGVGVRMRHLRLRDFGGWRSGRALAVRDLLWGGRSGGGAEMRLRLFVGGRGAAKAFAGRLGSRGAACQTQSLM
jgi:hypothetical protein